MKPDPHPELALLSSLDDAQKLEGVRALDTEFLDDLRFLLAEAQEVESQGSEERRYNFCSFVIGYINAALPRAHGAKAQGVGTPGRHETKEAEQRADDDLKHRGYTIGPRETPGVLFDAGKDKPYGTD